MIIHLIGCLVQREIPPLKMHVHSRLRPLLITLFSIALFSPSTKAAPFDDDVNSLGAPNRPEQSDVRKRLLHGGNDAVTALVKGVDSPNRQTKIEITRTIKQIVSENKSLKIQDAVIKEFARKLRLESDPSMRGDMLGALRDMKGPNSLKELEELASSDADESVRRDATLYAAGISVKEIAFFRKQTKDKSRLVQLLAYSQLARSGDKSGHDLALQTLKGVATNAERHDAIYLLGEIGDSADVPLLQQIRGMHSKTDPDSTWLAVQEIKTIELLQLPVNNRLSLLIKSLDDPSMTVRNWAYNKLVESPDPMTNLMLRKYLIDPRNTGRKEAADALSLR